MRRPSYTLHPNSVGLGVSANQLQGPGVAAGLGLRGETPLHIRRSRTCTTPRQNNTSAKSLVPTPGSRSSQLQKTVNPQTSQGYPVPDLEAGIRKINARCPAMKKSELPSTAAASDTKTWMTWAGQAVQPKLRLCSTSGCGDYRLGILGRSP